MTGKAQDDQFTLLEGREAPLSEQREVLRRKAKAIETPQTPPPPHRAPRGDMFREYAEKRWASPDYKQPTPEEVRKKAYRSLAESIEHSIYRRKKTIRGPIEKLRAVVGSNRYCEFAEWLKRIRLIKGASAPARYYSLLSLIEQRIEEMAIEYRYTYDDFDVVSFYESTKKHLDTARDRARKARSDTAELQPLLYEVSNLYLQLGIAKRMAASPTPGMSDGEVRALVADEAQKARSRRVAESRQWLRDLTVPDKRSDEDVRCGGRWITLANLAEVLGDDLRGVAGRKALWASLPAVVELAQDYRISQRDARRLLTRYTDGIINHAGAASQDPAPTGAVPSAPGGGDHQGTDRLEECRRVLQSAQGTGQVPEVAAASIRGRLKPRRP